MDIIAYAMQMELDGKGFYEKSAREATRPEFKKIFLHLAEEEQRHYLFFKGLQEGQVEAAGRELENNSSSLVAKKNLFRQMVDNGAPGGFSGDAKAVWLEALKIEERAEKLYRDHATAETDEARRRLLNLVADEEKTHVYLIDNVLSFMADPASFAESTRFQSFLSWEGR